jgi:hypothetical protein
MAEIKEVLEIFEPTEEVVADLLQYRRYIVKIKGTNALRELKFHRYASVAPKFVSDDQGSRYTMDQIDYIVKLKEK